MEFELHIRNLGAYTSLLAFIKPLMSVARAGVRQSIITGAWRAVAFQISKRRDVRACWTGVSLSHLR